MMEEGKLVWTINYHDHMQSQYLQLILNGKTGEQLSLNEVEMVGN